MDNHHVEEEHDPTVHHEERDINVRGVLVLTAIFVVFMGVLFFGTWFLFKGFAHAERKKDRAPLSDVKSAAHQQPPAPRLQPFPEVADEMTESTRRANEGIGADLSPIPTREPIRATPIADLQEMRHEFDSKTTTYGWVNRSQGTVRIPIAEAKKRLLAQGLPVAAPATAGTSAVSAATTETTSGNVPTSPMVVPPGTTPMPAPPPVPAQTGRPAAAEGPRAQ